MQFLLKRASFRLCLHDEKEKWSQSSGRKLWNVPRNRFWNLNKSRLLNSMLNDGLRPSAFTVNKLSMKPPARPTWYWCGLQCTQPQRFIYHYTRWESTFGTKQNKAPAVWSINYESSGRSQSWSHIRFTNSSSRVLSIQWFKQTLAICPNLSKVGTP